MIVNNKGISAENPNEFIKDAGTYTLKVISIEEDGYTDEGAEKIRVAMRDNKGRNYGERLDTGGKFAWKFRQFCDAFKAPDGFDTDHLIGRYIVISMVINAKGYLNSTKFDYAVQNDKLEPIPSADEAQAISEEAEDVF